MKRIALGLGVTMGLAFAVACGDSSTNQLVPDGGADSGPAGSDDAGTQHDANAPIDASADAGSPEDSSVSADGPVAPAPDAGQIEDAAPDGPNGPNVGADAGSLPDASPACTATPSGAHTAFTYELDGVSVGADGGATTVTVPDGFPLSASISLATGFPGTATETDTLTAYDPTLGVGASVGGPSGKVTPAVILGAGDKIVRYGVQETFVVNGNETATRYGYQIVDVCGATIPHAVLPAFPELTAVNIEASGLDGLKSIPQMPLTFELWTPDLTFVASNTASPSDGGTSVTIPMMVPTGVPLIPRFTDFDGDAVTGAPVTLTGDAQIAAPARFTISGTISSPDTTAPGAAFVQCTNGPASPFALSDSFSALVTSGAPYTYSLGISQGETCLLGPTVDLPQVGSPSGWSYLTKASSITASADATRDFTLPTTGPLSPFTTTVVDARGKPLNNVNVTMNASSATTSALGGYRFSAFAETKTGNTSTSFVVPGTYSIQVQVFE